MQQRLRRTRSIRGRTSIPAFASEQPVSDQQTQFNNTLDVTSSTSSEPTVLKTCKDLVSKYHSIRYISEISSTDPKVLEIKKKIETYMPQLYELSNNPPSNTSIIEINRVKGYAEAILKSFPDFNPDRFRQPKSPNDSLDNSDNPIDNNSQNCNNKDQSSSNPDASTKSLGSSSTSTFSNEQTSSDSSSVKQDTKDNVHTTIDDCTSSQKAMLLATHELMLRHNIGKQSFDWRKAPIGLPPDEIKHILTKNQPTARHPFPPGLHYSRTYPNPHTNTTHPNMYGYSNMHSYDGMIPNHRR